MSIIIWTAVPIFADGTSGSANHSFVFNSTGGANLEREAKTINLIPGDSSFETEAKSCAVGYCGSGLVRWALDESEKYDGRQSLKFYFPDREWVHGTPILISREQTNRVFTFSIYAKADQEGIPCAVYLIKTDWTGPAYENKFQLTREWKRYSVSSETNKIKAGEYWFAFGASPSNRPCNVWVDAYQLEEGDKPAPYRNRDVNFGLQSGHGLVFFPDEKVKARILVADRRKFGNTLPFTCRVSDYYGRVVQEAQKQIGFDKEGYACEELIAAGLNPGFYTVRAGFGIKEGNSDVRIFTFVVVNPPKEIEKGQMPFCGLIEETHGKGEAMKRIGSKWLEIVTSWSEVEQVKGNYNWAITDRRLADKPPFGCIKLMLFSRFPKWALNKTETADYEAKGTKQDFLGLLPDTEHLPDWRKFVRQVAKRYKDKVDIFEIGGESDLVIGYNPYYLAKYKEYTTNGVLVGGPAFKRYTEMISIACHEIKQVAPNARIGIIRPSNMDCTDKPRYIFSRAVLRQCGTNLQFDAFPMDCYTTPWNIGPDLPDTALPEHFLIDDLNEALDLCRKYGRGQPVYISEFGYALDITVPPDGEYAREIVKRLTRSYLIARMIKGVKCLSWFGTQNYVGKYMFTMWRDGLPLPSVAAYSAVARVVENVRDSREIPMDGMTKIVVFRKSNQADAAVWMVKGKGKLILRKVPEGLTVTDVMDSPLAGERTGDRTIIGIGEEPVYLNLRASNIFNRLANYINLPGLNSFDRLSRLLGSAELSITPVHVQLAIPSSDKGTVILHNQTAQDLKAKIVCMVGSVSVTNDTLVTKGAKTDTTFDLPPALAGHKETAIIEADCGIGFEKVRESFFLGGYMVCKRITAPVMIDGECGEWRGRTNIVMNERVQIIPPDPWITWDGTNDLSAIVYTGWDETNFYFAAEVWDDLHFNQKTGREIWNGDGFQMAFIPLAVSDAGSASVGYGTNDTEIGLALTQGGPETAQWNGTGTVWRVGKCALRRDEAKKMTYYETAIPWATLGILPKPGKIFGFNFVLFDDDTGTGQNYHYQLSPGITGGKTPALFKCFILDD